jgi:hypothetical protein
MRLIRLLGSPRDSDYSGANDDLLEMWCGKSSHQQVLPTV